MKLEGRPIDIRDQVQRWIELERYEYADKKFSGANLQQRHDAMAAGDWQAENDFIMQYIKKAEIFGFDTPKGLQQLGKAAVTVIATIERVMHVYGIDMPKPGLTSGEIETWE